MTLAERLNQEGYRVTTLGRHHFLWFQNNKEVREPDLLDVWFGLTLISNRSGYAIWVEDHNDQLAYFYEPDNKWFDG